MSEGAFVTRERQPEPPLTLHAPVSPDDDPALERRNLLDAAALWGIAIILFAGSLAVAFLYLALS